jgi:hypothetical protein
MSTSSLLYLVCPKGTEAPSSEHVWSKLLHPPPHLGDWNHFNYNTEEVKMIPMNRKDISDQMSLLVLKTEFRCMLFAYARMLDVMKDTDVVFIQFE